HGHRLVYGQGAGRTHGQGHLHHRRSHDRTGEQRSRPPRAGHAARCGGDHRGCERTDHGRAVYPPAPNHREAGAAQSSVSSRQEPMTHFVRRTIQVVAALAVLAGVAHAQTPLSILTPNGGEVWPVGASRDIVWSGATRGNVRIELSRDGGVSWETLFAETPNDGMEPWTVRGPALACRIRVTLLDVSGLSDVSDGDFSITSGVVVTAPNGGETWEGLSQQL